jgi:hypothetical protein
MNTVTAKAYSEITQMMYEVNTEISIDLMNERLNVLERATRNIISEEDMFKVAADVSKMWMPCPSSVNVEYNTVEYNTVEIFCLCVNRAVANF